MEKIPYNKEDTSELVMLKRIINYLEFNGIEGHWDLTGFYLLIKKARALIVDGTPLEHWSTTKADFAIPSGERFTDFTISSDEKFTEAEEREARILVDRIRLSKKAVKQKKEAMNDNNS